MAYTFERVQSCIVARSWHPLLTFVLLICRRADGIAIVPAMHMGTGV
jgi:hypothetical protein